MTDASGQTPVKRPGVLGRLRAWFLTGLLVTAPVLLTVYITWAAIELIDRNQSSRSGTTNSAAPDGVGARTSATKSAIVKSIS